MKREFTCAACEGEKIVEFDEGENIIRSTWSTHVFSNLTGRVDKVVTVYSCSAECALRIASSPPTKIVDEALDWLGGGV